jgi:hypothetical protein
MKRWTEKEAKAYEERRGAAGGGRASRSPAPGATGVKREVGAPLLTNTPVKQRKGPNRTEREYEQLYLLPEKMAGELLDYKFHSICLVLGFDFRYYPDYFVLPRTGRPQVHEVKGGYKREDAMKTFKAAVEQFGGYFDFYLCEKLDSGEWRITRYDKGG